MKRSLAALGVVLAITGAPTWFGDSAAAQEQKQAQKNVVVHLSRFTNDLHAAAMALKLAKGLRDKGAQVTLVLDLEGVRLADGRQPLDLRWGQGPPAAELYDAFVKAGGAVVVCPHCAAAVGLEEKGLRPGSRMSTEDGLAATLLAADTILDY